MPKGTYREVKSREERATEKFSDFPKMGTSVLSAVVNVSGKRSSYTKMVPKKTEGRGASPTGVKKDRGSTLIHEANGPSYHITATLYKANSAEASKQLRNTKLVGTVIERPDHVGSGKTFWEKRTYGQKT